MTAAIPSRSTRSTHPSDRTPAPKSADAYVATLKGRLSLHAALTKIAAKMNRDPSLASLGKGVPDDLRSFFPGAKWETRTYQEDGAHHFYVSQNVRERPNLGDSFHVSVKGNIVTVERSDEMHYGANSWRKDVAVGKPVNAQSLAAAVEKAMLEPRGREGTGFGGIRRGGS